MKISKLNYNDLIDNIGSTIQRAKENAIKAINSELVKSKLGNWQVYY